MYSTVATNCIIAKSQSSIVIDCVVPSPHTRFAIMSGREREENANEW